MSRVMRSKARFCMSAGDSTCGMWASWSGSDATSESVGQFGAVHYGQFKCASISAGWYE
jgi:hypothetical protein